MGDNYSITQMGFQVNGLRRIGSMTGMTSKISSNRRRIAWFKGCHISQQPHTYLEGGVIRRARPTIDALDKKN